MSDVGLEPVDVKKVMEEIRAEVRRRQAERRAAGAPSPDAAQGGWAPPLPDKREYGLGEFLIHHDREFVHYAYAGLLKREPDQAGMRHFIDGLRSAALTKVDVLGRIRYSGEGRAVGVKVRGLAPAFAVGTLGRVPVLGRLVRTSTAMAALPGMAQSLQRLENASYRKFQEQEARLLALSRELADLRDMVDQRHGATADSLATLGKDLKNVSDLKADWEALRKLEADKADTAVLLKMDRELRREISAQQRLLGELRREGAPEAQETSSGRQALSGDMLEPLYVSFEDHFRGSREEIARRQEAYLPVLKISTALKSGLPVLDIGCGRGEWLETLAREGFKASGVDVNAIMAAECRDRGLDVARADAVEHLRSLPDACLGAVTAFHVVEHLPLETLVALLDETMRVLAPQGVAVFETPNPENLRVGSCLFYLDPTHRNPIPPEALRFLVSARGFEVVGTLPLNPDTEMALKGGDPLTDRLNTLLYGPMDYAVVARKA